MTDLNSFTVTANVSKILAAQYNLILPSAIIAQISNATTMSGTVTLTDADTPIQRFDCNGANRIVKMPAYSTSNHPYFIINTTAATYTLDVQSSAGATLLSAPLPANGGNVLILPDGTAGFKQVGGGGTWGSITGTLTSQTDLQPPRGFMQNGKIAVSVASNNITLALKGKDGNDPSASNPVSIYLSGAWRQVTAALSVTFNAGANNFNSGSAELATIEIDYFAYLGYNSTDGIVIGFARIPNAKIYSDFNTTSTNEKYCKISTITNAAASDEYVVIGRFAATLSAGAGYTWTVPTYTAKNLIQYPTYETRWLTWAPTIVGYSANPATPLYTYKVNKDTLYIILSELNSGTSNNTATSYTIPFAITNGVQTTIVGPVDNGTAKPHGVGQIAAGASTLNCYLQAFVSWTASGSKRVNYISITTPF